VARRYKALRSCWLSESSRKDEKVQLRLKGLAKEETRKGKGVLRTILNYGDAVKQDGEGNLCWDMK